MTENMTRQKKLFTEMPVWKAIAAFGGPSVAVILVMILYNMADMFFVGMTGDTAQVAAVSLASPVFSIAMALGAMIGGGASILISARLGQKDYSAVRTYSAVAAWWSLFLGLVLGIGVFLFRTPLIYAIGANDEIYPYSVAYAGILCTGMPAMIFTTSVGNIVRAEGAIKESFLGSILPTLINLALDPVFILGLHMGAAGAAIATVIANYVGLLYFVFYFLKGNTSCTLSFQAFLEAPLSIGRIVILGFPTAISTLLGGFASAIANRFLVAYGTNAVAAMAAASKAGYIIGMIDIGLVQGLQPMISYNHGAGNRKRLNEVIRDLSILTILLGVIALVFCELRGDLIVKLFLKEASALNLGTQMVHILILSAPIVGLYNISVTCLQATEKAGRAVLLSAVRQGIVLIPCLFVMNDLFGIFGNVWAHIVSDILSTALAGAIALHALKQDSEEFSARGESARTGPALP